MHFKRFASLYYVVGFTLTITYEVGSI